MDQLTTLINPLLGMLGVIVGSVLNEYLRRRRRIEEYSSVIFTKRLEAYETLMSLLRDGSGKADEVINNAALSSEERHELISSAVLSIAKHVDRNVLYMNEELNTHCVALFMGIEEIHDAPESERQHHLEAYRKLKKEAYRMITEDSGIMQMNKLFERINRPRFSGAVIEAVRELRRAPQTAILDPLWRFSERVLRR
jgi:hypothetical protein